MIDASTSTKLSTCICISLWHLIYVELLSFLLNPAVSAVDCVANEVMDKSTNVQPLKAKPNKNIINHGKWTPSQEQKPNPVKQTADKGISERELQIGLIESVNRLRIARPPRLFDPTRQIKTETIKNEDIKANMGPNILDQIKRKLHSSLEEESLEDINECVAADDDTATDDEDYSIPEYSDSESTISTDVEQVKKPPTPVYEVERKTSLMYACVEKPPKKRPDELLVLRQNKESSSSITDSNIDITQKDSLSHDQESSGDDQPKAYFTEKSSEKWSEHDLQAIDSDNNNYDPNERLEMPSNATGINYDVQSDYDAEAECPKFSPSGQLPYTERQHEQFCPFLPPLPWLSRFRQKYSRPGWDSSPYNPNCNRPAWDDHLYIEAREKFKRHEAVKSRTNGFEFQLFPVAMANIRPNTNFNEPIYDINVRKPSLQHNAIKSRSSSTTRAASKMSSPQFRRQQMSQSPGYPDVNNNPNENNGSIKESQRVAPSTDNVLPSPAKTMVSLESPTPPMQLNKNPLVTEVNAKASIETKPSVIHGILKTSGSNTPKLVPFHQRDYSPSWRKIAMEERKKATMAAKERPNKEPEKPRPLNPLPRVALLCKANHRKSTSGCGGYYSPSMKPGVQVFDDRGRIKPQWDPSPYVPVGKRNAWDDSIPKSDYYRSKFIGWIM